MNGSPKSLDARGLPCPGPVLLAKRELEAGPGGLEMLVDNEAARDNVLRFAAYAGRKAAAEGPRSPDGAFLLRIEAAAEGGPSAPAADHAVAPAAEAAPGPRSEPEGRMSAQPALAVLLASDRLGEGDPALGALLAKGFLFALSELDEHPARIILMNGGVRLALEGSESLGHLRRLAEAGVEILACGTCLDFFAAKDRLAVGRVSNMYEIAGILARDRVLRP